MYHLNLFSTTFSSCEKDYRMVFLYLAGFDAFHGTSSAQRSCGLLFIYEARKSKAKITEKGDVHGGFPPPSTSRGKSSYLLGEPLSLP